MSVAVIVNPIAGGRRGVVGRIGVVARAFGGTVPGAPGVARLPATRVVIQADQPILFHVDGEPHEGGSTVDARIRPAAIRVRVKQAWLSRAGR
jgi:diacylglycerol kinase family enzyme